MQSKVEARAAEEAALAALRETAANATEEELSRLLDGLERDKAKAKFNLRRQLEVRILMVRSSSWTMERLAAKTKAPTYRAPADF